MRRPILAAASALALAGCAQAPQEPSLSLEEKTRIFDANYPMPQPSGIANFSPMFVTSVFFATDSDRLTLEAREELRVAAVLISARDPLEVVVEGHADERGNREHNLRLAARRALAARDYLITQGVAPELMRVAAFGVDSPVVACPREPCWRQNRRATVMLEQPPVLAFN